MTIAEKSVLNTRPVLDLLLGWATDGEPVLSGYFDTSFRDEAARNRLRLFVKNQRNLFLRKPQEGISTELLTDMFNRMDSALENIEPSINGWAVFVRGEEGRMVEFPSPVPFQNEISVNHIPNVGQLLQLSDNHETLLAAIVDSRCARIFDIALDDIQTVETIQSDVPGWHKRGGWSQLRYQHHIQELKNHHYQKVADYLTMLWDADQNRNILLMGEVENVSALKRHLPQRVLDAVVESLAMSMYESNMHVLEKVRDVMTRIERQKESQRLEQVIEQAFSGGFASVGLQQTIRAAQSNQIDTLYVLERVSFPAWKCTPCDIFDVVYVEGQLPEGCPSCGNPVHETSLIPELVLAVKKYHGEVDFVQTHHVLGNLDGMAARLRFK